MTHKPPQGIYARVRELRSKLGDLLADEDLTDEKLCEASEGLLPNIYDALAPPDPRKDLALDEREVIHAAIADCCFGRGGTIISWLQSPSAVEERIIERLAKMRGAKR